MRKVPSHSTSRRDVFLPWLNRFLTVALVITFIGIGALWIYLRTRPELPMIPPSNISAPREKAAPRMPQGKLLTDSIKEVLTEEELTSPEVKKLLKTLESPAYEAFIETDPSSIGDYLDFFQSQAIRIDKNEILAIFTDSESTRTPADGTNR